MVMIIGLPFANLGSAELQERLKHADRLSGGEVVVPKSSNSTYAYGPAGKELYENMCMNSVNQSIGELLKAV
jgi:chromosome transmission fidelity protein 1